MDPVTRSAKEFQRAFRAFRSDAGARVLIVQADLQTLGAVRHTVQGEEWHPENRSPFLLFALPHDAAGDCWVRMAERLRGHYAELRAGLLNEGATVPELAGTETARTRIEYFVRHLERWVECTRGVLDPPLVCWFPPAVEDADLHTAELRALLELTEPIGVRFVLSECDVPLAEPLSGAGVAVQVAAFRLDEAAMKAWFARMMLAEPRKGRARGAPPGAAAPDVAPPPRPGPQPPSDEQVKQALEEEGLPPVLTATEGETLRRLIFSAGEKLGARDVAGALSDQHEAYLLCGRAGVPLEQGLMALVLAGYLVQAGRPTDAAAWFQEAGRLANRAKAMPQVAQALMGLAWVHLNAGALESAASVYRLAADAAKRADAFLLVVENLRMAGECLRRAGRDDQAIAAWREAVELGAAQPPATVAASCLPAVIAELKQVLAEHRMSREYEEVAGVEHRLLAEVPA